MEEVKIQGWIRNREAKPGHLRKEGYIPAVIYGR